MQESERLQRYHEEEEGDKELCERIIKLLNDPRVDSHCMVDAYYYDFSVIPHEVQQRLQLWRDCYLIYGIACDGEMISKWVERCDLDSSDPIVDGVVIRPPFDAKSGNCVNLTPELRQMMNAKLLSMPMPNLFSAL